MFWNKLRKKYKTIENYYLEIGFKSGKLLSFNISNKNSFDDFLDWYEDNNILCHIFYYKKGFYLLYKNNIEYVNYYMKEELEKE